MTTSRSEPTESAEFVGGPWDGRRADAVDGEPLPLVMTVPWENTRHRYVLGRLWYGGDDLEVTGYEYLGEVIDGQTD